MVYWYRDCDPVLSGSIPRYDQGTAVAALVVFVLQIWQTTGRFFSRITPARMTYSVDRCLGNYTLHEEAPPQSTEQFGVADELCAGALHSGRDVIVLILVLLICCCLCYLWYSSNQQNVPPHGVGYQPVINQPAAYPSAPPLAPNPLGNPPPYNLRFCSACQHPHTAYVTPAQIVNELPPPKCHIHVLDTHGSPNDKCSTPGFAGTERR
ncbi:hypothetical protein HPB51_017950 [Rhipicephalus microplus]|uniref:Uncharacterized protein n=1 Tax=Rhipicephalus microplus TaxID=6941 RepID=A0A9J6ENU2_RHIMP|nr:hypothetical protein HPB51_017950 [Rhipicephalus microplus]